jgi:phosphatidylserine decarboxylase
LAGGLAATLYLSPAMYHRVHSPADGEVVGWRYVPGRLFPVNALGVRSVPGLFTRNERVVVRLETPAFGPLAVVLIGAANVGRISLAFSDLLTNRGRAPGDFGAASAIAVRRGEEIGAFHLGSSVVLLAADPTLVPAARAGEVVRVGRPLFRRASGAPGSAPDLA